MRRFVLVVGLLLAAPLASAQSSNPVEAPEAAPLTQADVRELIRLRLIEIEVLEEAEADLGPLDNDENGPIARQRLEDRLEVEGWTYADYRALGERVSDALGAMAMEAELAEVNAEMEGVLAEMAGMLSADQVAEMRAGMAEHDEETRAFIDSTRPDWPAVQAFLPTFEELDAYGAGNRDTPPSLPAID